ncbi:helix-turn-helix domain-containing protein [Micromonospora cathayae]|uniref:Helix-turn-helix transcriptional regulator n=1 Tax=Micromonospora cathayae TaxID=3028804 RepID=A0ABY7ZLY3_9ACTN|nr:helix-turn-helix transcriptional regulator [Micromonospora sp. HUAS 3]WDZ83761.1 helix-turn-helix transcriptional regulator [Micromonospora sp. HUAS 3]
MEHLLEAPAYQRKRLSRRLMRTRRSTGLTQQQVAAELRWSQSKVTRIESGDVGISHTDLLALLTLYGLSDDGTVRELTKIADIARRPSLPQISDVHSKAFREYLENEQIAQTLHSFEPTYVPGLLQTPSYRISVLKNDYRFSSLSTAEQEEAERKIAQKVEVMQWRQQILLENGSLAKASFVVDEAVIRRTVGAEVGDTTIMREQLERLQAVLRNPKVDLRVIRFSSGAHVGMGSSSYILLDFPDIDDPTLLYEESTTGELTTREDEARIKDASSSFENLQILACRGAELESLLDEALAAL